MAMFMLLAGVIGAVAIIAAAVRVPNTSVRAGAAVLALLVLFVFTLLSSIRYVGDDEVGVVIKKVGFKNLPQGRILAVGGEKGPQAEVLPPGWHPWYWPVIFDIKAVSIIRVPEGQLGLITTTDGLPLPPGQIYAPEWAQDGFQQMLNAQHFLTDGGGFKGPQASVLTPGSYRLNPRLFEVQMVDVTNIEQATVGVVKSNVGNAPPELATGEAALASKGERGIWRTPYLPQKLYLNTRAYEVT
ncbi:MAG: hypothetical protein ACYTGC_11300, partial [Planctomycetota bacterium]